MDLPTFQKDMSSLVIEGDRASQKLKDLLKSYEPQELQERLAIYQNNTYHSLIEAVKDLYPSIATTVGDDFLSRAAKLYIQQSPPRSAAMVDFAHDFPDFLSQNSEEHKIAYLCDLAKLDLHQHLSYHAKDETSVQPAFFATLDIETLAASKVKPVRSAHLLASPFAIFDMWQLARGDDIEEIHADTPQNILVIRQQESVEVYCIAPGLFAFLEALTKQHTIVNALEIAAEHEDGFNPTDSISFLIQSGFSAGIIGES
ncbi:MAG: DNA-binding domain-containing protein [Agarilytica sp.]